eukprot:5111750-Lingulodinium_polyedra.AAC.1
MREVPLGKPRWGDGNRLQQGVGERRLSTHVHPTECEWHAAQSAAGAELCCKCQDGNKLLKTCR